MIKSLFQISIYYAIFQTKINVTNLDLLLADGVVAAGVVVGGVLLARDQLLGVEQLPVGADPHLAKVVVTLCKV